MAGSRKRLSNRQAVLHAGSNASWTWHTVNQDVLVDGPAKNVSQLYLFAGILQDCTCDVVPCNKRQNAISLGLQYQSGAIKWLVLDGKTKLSASCPELGTAHLACFGVLQDLPGWLACLLACFLNLDAKERCWTIQSCWPRQYPGQMYTNLMQYHLPWCLASFETGTMMYAVKC